eukprot:CAMPEP_0116086976 /NCGR_PEP_ID=MMETSP0327-20121206/5131_1 /TAXON_ID=44447 /ORGANISM="Pseudo-nitzschia delicatissima, Strain B596" /LENGTH=526 /DNA_ID=CAMNT_0003578041 /DNA_START=165 /DNA_END=1745 /DNA_ORIENTATION=-
MKGEDLGDLPENSSNMMQNDKRPGLSIGRKRPGRVLIKELNDNDVLQGRGSGSMQNTGNIKFRNLVEKLRPAYVATSSRKEKAKMISDMVQLIQSRKGRFLQRLCDKEVEELGLDLKNGESHGEQDHYVEMTDEEAAEKAKQAIRYVHYKKVPLEEERRKKRVADSGFFTVDNKTNSNESTHGIGYGGSAPIPTNLTNQLARSQVQQSDISQLLASVQTVQNSMSASFPGHKQVSVMKQLANSMIPMVGNVQQQPHTLQQLASSLFQNNNGALAQKVAQASSSLLDNTGNQNTNQPQISQQQAQVNILLQGILQQQANAQQSTILQTILQAQQQQEQTQLNSALQTLQQQQKSSEQNFQQHIQQQNANSVLASLLSSATTSTPMGPPALNPLMGHPGANGNPAAGPIGATNALLASLLSNNATQASAFQQAGNSQAQGTSQSNPLFGGLLPSINAINGSNLMQQQNQGLAGTGSIQRMPGLAQNVNTLLAANVNNSTIGQAMVKNTNRSTAKRRRLASDNISDSSK